MDKPYAAWAARWRVPLGFVLGAAYLVFSQPTVTLLATGGGITLLGLALRAFSAGCLEKNLALTTGGPYRYTRNPLYLGSFFIGLGFALAGGSWTMGLVFLVFFLMIYWPVMRREERFLRAKFGDLYGRYAEKVPFFFPTGHSVPDPGVKFRWDQYRRNHEYEAALGYLAAMFFLLVKMKLR
jgi:protein-S-isoprenylcysteine O-methyltransferase Ste14